MAFHEVRLDDDIAYGSAGGPEFATDVIELSSGHEVRNIRWSEARRRWDVGYAIVNQSRLHTLRDFFIARRGRAHGFRFKDWSDFFVVDEPLTALGNRTIQLTKAYTSGGVTHTRDIKKPVSGTVIVKRNGIAAAVTVDFTTGIVTLDALNSFAISAISKAANGVVTTTFAHGFSTGTKVWLRSVGGMVEVNDRLYTITLVSSNSFSLNVDTSGYTTYTSGGLAERYDQPGADLKWTGEYDVPVRFDTDRISARLDAYAAISRVGAFSLDNVPVVEIRV